MAQRRAMIHPPDVDCGICNKVRSTEAPIFQNELWLVRPITPPCVVPGWMLLLSRRHVPGPAAFDDAEAASFGPTLRHLQRVLLEVTGALRIYNAAMGESSPHFHGHMVPRYATMPLGAKGWAVFDLQRAAQAGELEVPEAEVARVTEAYRLALASDPPPP
jgi:diadenosine tetraphosphate (Ap4A) HIT family hydrolase